MGQRQMQAFKGGGAAAARVGPSASRAEGSGSPTPTPTASGSGSSGGIRPSGDHLDRRAVDRLGHCLARVCQAVLGGGIKLIGLQHF